MKRHFFAAVLVCVVSAACDNTEDPVAGKKGRVPLDGDPVGLLRALDAASASDSGAARVDRALIQEKLGLRDEALRSWDAVLKNGSPEQKREAREHRAALSAARTIRWDPDQLDEALRQHNEAMVRQIARTYPSDAVRHFEDIDLLDVASSSLLADALYEAGETYARAIVDAAIRTKDRKTLEDGLRALRTGDDQRAAELLERADNPLYLAVRFRIAATQFKNGVDPLPILAPVAPLATAKGYRDLAARTHALRGVALDLKGQYTEALAAYDDALLASRGEESTTVEVLERRSESYTNIGDPAQGFREAFAALSLLPAVEDLNARHQAYSSAAWAARDLQFPAVALQFQNAAVAETIAAVAVARGEELKVAKRHLAVALRSRAEIHLILRRDAQARADLQTASALADAAERPAMRDLLKMRVEEVQGQALVERQPEEAAKRFTTAIALAEQQNSTYRAVLHYERAIARQKAGDPKAGDDIDRALAILRDEATRLREETARGAYERVWNPYFSRFQSMYHQMIENRLGAGDAEGAFVYAEQARAFEPMQLLLQAGPAPPGFRLIDSKADLAQALATLPDDTLILQYLVLEDKTYSWSLSRGSIRGMVYDHVGRKAIQERVNRIHCAVAAGQNSPFTVAMRAVYDELFRAPLRGSRHKRVVIVPDGPMHGLPFAALESTNEGFLIERSSIATTGSTSLYFYALHRDAEFPANPRPSVLIVREPTMDRAIASRYGLGPLKHAVEEANQLHADYAGSELLAGDNATSERFLASAKNATIIHFAGHGVANPGAPWLSMLVLAPQGKDAGDLTAEKLLIEPSDFGQTRLIVLAACSTAFGESVGAEGLAPLVRPLIAARVPAVVGTTWDVKDTATIRELMVSLHRHYRNGDDVAVALRKAQLDMLRKHEPARVWAALQVIGYAGSPYAPHAAQEKTNSEPIHPQDSLHRPDGLHSQ
ncbi:MAG TPA: CHAT domain-containing protein [Thermoanaerobaculia bacterium]|nr:CHAT domain-containing protein [Thermoanaerobaculia bacterium]